MTTLNMKTITAFVMSTFILFPSVSMADGHDHNHNHFNPALEALGNDIIGLTVCYKNGFLSDEDQEPAFKNLIAHAGVDGNELGMFYMNSLGAKAEAIMSSEEDSALWTESFCHTLTETYLDTEKLAQKKHHDHGHHHGHDHHHHHENVSQEVLENDIKQGRLLEIK